MIQLLKIIIQINQNKYILLDNKDIDAKIYTLGTSPWRLFDIDTQWKDQSEYYNRIY